jgi:Fur family transcriptional regulator, ferric uptake regulator
MRTATVYAVTPWLDSTRDALREAGFRSGGARSSVLELLAAQRCCVSAQELHDQLEERGRGVGIASVYRVLDTLLELRLVQRVDLGDGVARYEPSGVGDHHHHLVCGDCGKVEPFTDPSLELAIEVASSRLGYAVAGHEVVLRGECGECREGPPG